MKKVTEELLVREIKNLRLELRNVERALGTNADELWDANATIDRLRSDVRNLEWEVASYKSKEGGFDAKVQEIYDRDQLFYAMNKIPFIKVVREETHLGLKEAKDLVDKFFEKGGAAG